MNVPPVHAPPGPPAHLHARRCVRHPSREAAARCPRCTEFFCRECVTEHEGKLLCSSCLAKVVAKEEGRGRRIALIRRAVTLTGGVAMLWLIFYAVGVLLLKIPPDFHDGTIWQKVTQTEPR